MKTELQHALALIAPSISIATFWEHDPDFHDIRQDCDGFEDANPADWQAWQSEIRATAIKDGATITGNAYLGGTWEAAGDNPAITNPDISGYENQMTAEALEMLAVENPHTLDLIQINKALAFIATLQSKPYDEQRAALATTATR